MVELPNAVKPNPDIMSRLIQESPVDHDFQEDDKRRYELTKTSAFLSVFQSIDSCPPSADKNGSDDLFGSIQPDGIVDEEA